MGSIYNVVRASGATEVLMETKLTLKKETIHRLGGSARPRPEQDASRNANQQGMNVDSSIYSTLTLGFGWTE